MVLARFDVPLPGPRPRPRFAGVAEGVSIGSSAGVAAPDGLALASSKLPSPIESISMDVNRSNGVECSHLHDTCHPA
mgnify:CR=1 FL=1